MLWQKTGYVYVYGETKLTSSKTKQQDPFSLQSILESMKGTQDRQPWYSNSIDSSMLN